MEYLPTKLSHKDVINVGIHIPAPFDHGSHLGDPPNSDPPGAANPSQGDSHGHRAASRHTLSGDSPMVEGRDH